MTASSDEDSSLGHKKVGRFLRRYFYEVFAPPVLLALVWLLSQTVFFQQLENLTVNWRFRLRTPWDQPADERIIVVGVDEVCLKRFGAWP